MWAAAPVLAPRGTVTGIPNEDRKSTRLNSSHRCISYAVFCLKKKKNLHSAIFFGPTLGSFHGLVTVVSLGGILFALATNLRFVFTSMLPVACLCSRFTEQPWQ